jgi:ssDNA-binding Zn-finger/Zn-ribbon topoisomerase 1
MQDIKCGICGLKAEIKDSKVIYGKSYGLIYVCSNYPKCDSYVGCHKGTATPLGTVTDKKTRKIRTKAHSIFDPLWKEGNYERSELYHEVGIKMNKIPLHIGQLNFEECEKLIEIVEKIKIEVV